VPEHPTTPLRRGSAWKNPTTILITGASGGLGGALAREYARPGRTLILHGRDPLRLAAIVEQCSQLGAQVLSERFDLCDAATASATLHRLAGAQRIDLAIVNAGVSRVIGDGEEAENWEVARALLAVNLDGALLTVAALLPDMRQRGSGQLALISSLAAYVGLPITPTYCASKAALKAYGEALRGWLAPQGIAVSVVLPGFVDTPMSAQFRGPKPGMISAARAARLIRRGLERNSARIEFPRALAFGTRILAALPAAAAQRILRALGVDR